MCYVRIYLRNCSEPNKGGDRETNLFPGDISIGLSNQVRNSQAALSVPRTADVAGGSSSRGESVELLWQTVMMVTGVDLSKNWGATKICRGQKVAVTDESIGV